MKLNEIPSVNMVSQVVLAGVLLVVAAVEANPKGGVRFWMNSVTLQCPEEGEWFYGNGTSMIDTNDIKLYYDYKYKGSKDQFHCKYKSQSTPDAPDAAETLETYYFYIQGNACENCLELDALVFAVVIAADLIGTVIIMILIYKCTKNKAAGSQRAPNCKLWSVISPLK
ncbi:T-cell surface glycoprotein CD3 epsilon chain-like isoform X2 [Periophthalmus magnuspinnatus]|uniref:T-cell surface glycoprotein CD3 epsilon chain-like isoform X2 n=1 Tax=Periophthalmus magnuspinnatus TaxID=409849 RepID=UPI002436D8D6|nr:T-cell surface glycoprotein CD3 epsilon chain-like isoform X2 [Periophthalmus magnuspinnatus]